MDRRGGPTDRRRDSENAARHTETCKSINMIILSALHYNTDNFKLNYSQHLCQDVEKKFKNFFIFLSMFINLLHFAHTIS